MRTIVFVFFVTIISLSSCDKFKNDDKKKRLVDLDNQKPCLLDFSIGMRDDKYLSAAKKYYKEGILREKKFRKPPYGLEERIIYYRFEDINKEGNYEPIFLTDRLDALRIYFGEDASYEKKEKVTINDYNELLRILKKDYGRPNNIWKDSTGNQSVTWDKGNFKISALFNLENDLSKDQIAILFEASNDVEEALMMYNMEKKKQRKNNYNP